MTSDDVLKMLRGHITYDRNQRQLAKEIGVSPAFLGVVLRGKKPLSNSILDFLGLERRTVYVMKEPTP